MTRAKVYNFSAEPTAFRKVVEKIDNLAIDRHTSRSEVIVEILSNYVGLDHKRSLRRMDYSGVLSGRLENVAVPLLELTAAEVRRVEP